MGMLQKPSPPLFALSTFFVGMQRRGGVLRAVFKRANRSRTLQQHPIITKIYKRKSFSKEELRD